MQVVRLGIIGCGNVTTKCHLPALVRLSNIKVVALSDIDAAVMARAARLFDFGNIYRNYRDLIADPNVDAVAVCVPPSLHTETALAAITAGKHTFIEKPPTLVLSDCDLLSDAAAQSDTVKVAVGFNLRWHRLVRETREIIRREGLGPIRLMRSVFTNGAQQGQNSTSWRNCTSLGGGALLDLGIHHFDLFRFLMFDEVAEICAASGSDSDAVTITARMRGGARIVSAFCNGTGANHEIEIYGDYGWLRLSLYRANGLEQFDAGEYPGASQKLLVQLKQTLRAMPHLIRRVRQGGDQMASYTEEWRSFAAAIIHNAPVECGLADGRRALEIALAADEANRTNRAIELPSAAGGKPGLILTPCLKQPVSVLAELRGLK